jgi:FixJ family two-component response regulator
MVKQNHRVYPVGTEVDVLVTELRMSRSAPFTAESVEIQDDVLLQVPTVFVIDPDPATGALVKELLAGYKFAVEVYASGREFFADYAGDQPGCLVLEQRIFDISGLQIQRRLAEQNQRLPMVYVTSGLDVSTAVVLMREGAVHVLEKPLRSIELLNAIQEAVAIDERNRRQASGTGQVREWVALLTRKERQLVGLVASAKATKSIAAELGICPRAVELRRRGVMDKLGLKSSLELLRFSILAWQECSKYLDSAEAGTMYPGSAGADY